jgi:LysM repeat protein
MVGWRNPARYLAPLAIAAVATAAYMIVHHALVHKHTPSPAPLVVSTTVHTTSHHPPIKAKSYVVRPNDTLSKIAAKVGVSLGTLQLLNPKVNPQALQPGTSLRLRR